MTEPKGAAIPLKRTKKQAAALLGVAAAEARAEAMSAEQENATRLAQIVNLHLSGHSLSDIGARIGATAAEVDRMITQDAARYVRSQPALRTYVRNWISGKYTAMLDADWDVAIDKNHKEKLEHQDRVMRMLDRMAKLHGAEAPTQSEVKIEAAPEAVEKMVSAIAASQGLNYDTDIFDVVDAEVVHEAVEQSARALEVSGSEVEKDQPGDGEGL